MRFRGVDTTRLAVLAALGGCGTPGVSSRCGSPEPILVDGATSGYVRCRDGAVDRVGSVAADPTIQMARCVGDEDEQACRVDADCGPAAISACVHGTLIDGPGTFCACVHACQSDADCGQEQVCVPRGALDPTARHSSCATAACKTGSDCASGECGAVAYDNGCWTSTTITCREPASDTCRAAADCDTGTTCADTGSGWECLGVTCAIGRPLHIDGAPRVAPVRGDVGWADAPDVRLPDDPALCSALAARWAQIGALEHASVASFARVVLELLGLGAPADLIADTQRAAADEVRHARLAFGLASAYAGAPVGPGPLDLRGVVVGGGARAFLHALIDEACVGETLGAAEAAVAATRVDDPLLAATLAGIADDEARHAALAWRTLRWLVSIHPELRDEARARVTARVAAHLSAAPDPWAAPRHGFLGPTARDVYDDAAQRVVTAAAALALA